jgi:hypothetical protein
MTVLGLLFGAIIGALVFVFWMRWRKMVDAEAEMFAPRSGKTAEPRGESLEAFIAAYQRGEVSIKPQAAAPAVAPPIAAAPAATPAIRREAFLSGAARLLYLACKTSLRDHHCFAHVHLQSLCTGRLEGALQGAAVDILVCDAAMHIVAALDIVDAPAAADAAKADCLRSLGIRHLRLSAKSLPRPGELRDLIYRV